MKIYYFKGDSGRIYCFPTKDWQSLFASSLKIDHDIPETKDIFEYMTKFLSKKPREGSFEL